MQGIWMREAIVSRGSKSPQGFNTTNAWAHLRKNHQEVFNKIQEKKENDLKGTNNNDKANINRFFSKETSKKEIMDEKIGLMIIRDLQPISFVENEGFKDLINSLDADYSIYGRYFYSQSWIPNYVLKKPF